MGCLGGNVCVVGIFLKISHACSDADIDENTRASEHS